MTTHTSTLTELDLAVLALEREVFLFPAAKSQVIADRFNLSPAMYYLHVSSLLDREDVLAHDPALVRRLRARRGERGRSRVRGL